MSEIKVNSIKGVAASSAAITISNTDGTCTANITNNLSNRNVMKNSAMQIAQRGTSFTSVTSSAYYLDRFYLYLQNSSAAFTVTQSTDSPDGFGNSLKLDVTTADDDIAPNEEIKLQYKLEGFDVQRFAKGTSAAKKFTLSFYVKTTKTGVYCVELYDRDNNRDVSGSYTVSDTNWNRYTIDFPADTTGAFGNDNASSLEITWWLVAGSAVQGGTLNTAWRTSADASSATGQVNFTNDLANDWYLTGVQLEATDTGVATDFEHRSFAQELALCKRYYQQFPQSPADAYGPIAVGRIRNSTNAHLIVYFPEMRSSPTCTKVGNLRILHAATAAGVNSVASSHMSRNIIFIEGVVSSGLTQGEGCIMTANNDSTGKITLAAEL